MRLKELRKARGLTQRELAAELHTSRNTILRYEARTREPSVTMLVRMAAYFRVSLEELLGEGLDWPR